MDTPPRTGLLVAVLMLVAVALLVTSTGPSMAQPVPLGDEIIVNSTPEAAFSPHVASDAAGNFVVIWRNDDGTDEAIRGRRYDAAGIPQGTEFVVTADATSTADMDVAMAADGSFLVTWRSSTPSIVAQAYDAQGASRGEAFRVDTTIFDYYSGQFPGSNGDIKESPRAAAAADGGFMVVWSGGYNAYLYFRHQRRQVDAQMIDAAGALAGTEFRVGGDGYYHLSDPEIASNAAGDFVVVWDQTTSYTYTYHDEFPYMEREPNTELLARQIDGSDEVGVAVGTTPVVSVRPEGGFVVVWGPGMRARVFDESSAPVGAEIAVTSAQTDGFDVAAAADASFVAAWSSNDPQGPSDGSSHGVFARSFASDGVPRGDEVLLNSFTTGSQASPRVTFTGPDKLVAVWTSEGQGAGASSIVARLFARAPQCGDATADAELTATDALTALATAIGTRHCAPCVCDADRSGAIVASDALTILRASVGQPVSLDCAPC